jgi:epoxyqueuosine reductase
MSSIPTTAPDAGATPGPPLEARVRAEAERLGFGPVGIAPVRASDHAAFYRAWLEAGRHGTMDYLARPDAVQRRADPAAAWPGLRSAVVVALNYYPGAEPAAAAGAGSGIIARYARGRDYHRVMKKKLLRLLAWLEAEVGRELPLARAYVDTGPVLERELAQRAGLGWFGRNTMLIHPRRGSYFFLGSLLLDIELAPDAPFAADHCGTCAACVSACPTGALLGRDATGAPAMDATRCISYLTIEHRGPIPRELRPLLGNRVFGCDICQEVCPWNSPKLVQATSERDYLPRVPGLSGSRPDSESGTGTHPHPHTHGGPSTDAPSLVELMRMSYEEWDVWTRGSAIRRAGYAGFKRNVAVALGNWSAAEVAAGNWLADLDDPPEEALAVLREAMEDEDPLVRGHAEWALEQLE